MTLRPTLMTAETVFRLVTHVLPQHVRGLAATRPPIPIT